MKIYLILTFLMALIVIAICLNNRFNSRIKTIIFALIVKVLKCVSGFLKKNLMLSFMLWLLLIKKSFNHKINYTVIIKEIMQIQISVIIIS